uniref:SHR-BD domain-containing protein n=1 Tax=Steinernema glaseri TaxID=37863 RepID=A0A1I7ZRF7_9BILA
MPGSRSEQLDLRRQMRVLASSGQLSAGMHRRLRHLPAPDPSLTQPRVRKRGRRRNTGHQTRLVLRRSLLHHHPRDHRRRHSLDRPEPRRQLLRLAMDPDGQQSLPGVPTAHQLRPPPSVLQCPGASGGGMALEHHRLADLRQPT